MCRDCKTPHHIPIPHSRHNKCGKFEFPIWRTCCDMSIQLAHPESTNQIIVTGGRIHQRAACARGTTNRNMVHHHLYPLEKRFHALLSTQASLVLPSLEVDEDCKSVTSRCLPHPCLTQEIANVVSGLRALVIPNSTKLPIKSCRTSLRRTWKHGVHLE